MQNSTRKNDPGLSSERSRSGASSPRISQQAGQRRVHRCSRRLHPPQRQRAVSTPVLASPPQQQQLSAAQLSQIHAQTHVLPQSHQQPITHAHLMRRTMDPVFENTLFLYPTTFSRAKSSPLQRHRWDSTAKCSQCTYPTVTR